MVERKDGNFKTNRQLPVAAVLDEATGLPKIVDADTGSGLVGIPSQLLVWDPINEEWIKYTGLPDDHWKALFMGELPGRFPTLTSAENLDVEPGSAENPWYQGGLVQYLTADTTLYISSTNSADTTQTILVGGLTSTFEVTDAIATLNGQNQVALDNDMTYIRNTFNLGPGPVLGDVYVAESGAVTGGGAR